MHVLFADRTEAGRRLAAGVAALALPDPVVLALPRGGVIVALPIALALGAPLGLLLAGKIGARGQPELAVGAVAETPEGGEPALVVDEELVATPQALADVQERVPAVLAELARRRATYLQGRTPLEVAGRAVVVVDDGIATGATLRAALKALRQRHPASITVAAPVAPASQCLQLERDVDHLVCLAAPAWFGAVSTFFRDFSQVTDNEVVAALEAAEAGAAGR